MDLNGINCVELPETKPWFQRRWLRLGEGISEVIYQLHLNNAMYINKYRFENYT